MGDAILRERIQVNNRKEAVEKYDVHACAERHVYAYQQAVTHHKTGQNIKK